MSEIHPRLSSLSHRLVLILITLAALTGNSLWAASVQSIAVTPTWSRLTVGDHKTVQAKARFADGTTGYVTNLASWSSSNPAIATVSASGSVAGLHAGIATLTARYQGHSARTLVTVAVVRSIVVTPPSVRLSVGQSYSAKALAIFTDGETRDVTASASWTSRNTSVARVSTGKIAGLSTGETVVTASWSGHSGNASVNVSPVQLQRILISPLGASIPKGVGKQFKATGVYSNGTTKDLTQSVKWTSSNTNVATIASNGMAIGTGKGSTTVRATSGSISGSATLTVNAAVLKSVQITPKSAAVAIGATQAFSARGVLTDNTTQPLTSGVVWSSSNAKVASIEATTGTATGEGPGTATITATASHISGIASLTVNAAQLQSITVTPTNGSTALGLTQQFKAIGTYTDGGTKDMTTLVNWTTSNIAVATINAQGLASTPGTGTATVTAADPSSSIQGSTTFTVTAAQVASLTVTPATATVPLGNTQQYTATATLTDGTTQNVTTSVSWVSSQTSALVARPSASGLFTTVNIGQAGIIATAANGVHASATLNVTAAQLASIALSPINPSVAAGLTQQLTAQGAYTDGNTHDLNQQVTWSSQNPAIATVEATTGKVTGIAAGTTTLIATSNSNQSIQGTVQFQVTAAELTGITVSPSAGTAVADTTLQFTAQGTYTDGTTPDITSQVTWSTSDSTLATISNTAGTNGLATALKAGGPVIVTATLGSVSSTTQLTITQPALISIAVTPAAMSVPAGIPQRYGATASFSDSSTQDVTSSVTWSSSNPGVATISNNDDATRGLATTGAQGTTTISAAMNGISGSTTLSVTQPSITSIVLNNSVDNSMVFTQPAANPYPLFLAGFFSDGSTQNVTSLAGWTVSNPGVATTNGTDLFDGTLSGQSTITAVVIDAYGNVLRASLQVTNAFAPAPPTAVSAVNNDGSGVITVTWTPPADAIDSYQISIIETNSNNPGQVDETLTVPGTQTTATSIGLLAYGAQYYVVVTAHNAWGSTPSAPSATFTYVYNPRGCGGGAPALSPVRKAGSVTPDCYF